MCSIGASFGAGKQERVRVIKKDKESGILYLRILSNYQQDKDKGTRKKFRKIQLTTAKTSRDLDQIDINSIESSTSLIRIASAEKGSMKLIPPAQPETSTEEICPTIDTKTIEPVQLPDKDPHPVKIGHNFLIETSFEEPSAQKPEEELIGYNQTYSGSIISQFKFASEKYN